MYEATCDFLTGQPRDAPPSDVLKGIADLLETMLTELVKRATRDDFDASWGFGGNLGLVATDGHSVQAARAGDIRTIGLGTRPHVVHHENTLYADFPNADPAHHNVITAYLGGGHFPADLLRQIDPDQTSRLVLCGLGAARWLPSEQLATLSGTLQPDQSANAILQAGLASVDPAERDHTSCVCIVSVRRH
jgi:hypothetical protein